MPRQPTIPDTINADTYPLSLALFEAVKDLETSGKRIKPVNKLALCLSTTGEVETLREAADLLGMTPNALYLLTHKKHGKKFIADVERAFLKRAGTKAVAKIVRLSHSAKSEGVAMRASEWLTGVNGLSPTQKTEIQHSGGVSVGIMPIIHPDALGPGDLQKIFPNLTFEDDGDLIEGECVKSDIS